MEDNMLEVLCPYNSEIEGTHFYEPKSKDTAGKLGCIGYIPHTLNGDDPQLIIEQDGAQEYVLLPGYLHFQSSTNTAINGRYDVDDDKKSELIRWIGSGDDYNGGYVNIAFEKYDLNRGYYTIYKLADKSKKN
jgi:hypothetical protein